MWGLNRFQRPAWTTGTLIPCSFLCGERSPELKHRRVADATAGIVAGVLIAVGSKKTRKTAEVKKAVAELVGSKRDQRPLPTE
jgi:hypothetical protein